MSNAPVRLNKFLASGGLGSRRHCDALVKNGEITVNGELCTNPGIRVGPEDVVRHNRKVVSPKMPLLLLFYKPRGCVCTKDDELRRPTIYGFLPPKYAHLNHVGRLDQDSEGLLLLTNDGDIANRLSHPRHKTEKEYLVTISSAFDNEVLEKLVTGVHTPEAGKLQAKSVRRLSPRRVAIVLETGVKRQIREMFKALHLRVSKLVRTRIGSLTDPTLPPGRYRPLDEAEVALLMRNPVTKSAPDRPGKSAQKKPARVSTKSGPSRSGGRGAQKKQASKFRAPGRKSAKKGPGRRGR